MTGTDITLAASAINSLGSLMRIFVTGASGWIGSAVVPELIDAGHEVVGLARSDASAAALTAAGAEVVHGTVDDLDVLRAAAAASDGVIHLAFKHDIAFSGDFQGAAEADRRAVDTIGAALTGTDRPFVIASGVAGLAPGRVSTEQDMATNDGSPISIRVATAKAVLDLASQRRALVRGAARPHLPRRRGQRFHGDAGRAPPAPRVSPATPATAPTAGPPSTASTPPTCSASRSRRPPQDRCCTASRRRGSRSATSPK